MRVFEPPPRSTIILPDAPSHGPLVTPIDWSAGDRAIAQYFWTSTDKDADAWTCDEAEVRRVIRFGMKAQPVPHGTPSGHGVLTVLADRVPLAVAEQLLRHRVQVHSPDGNSMGWLEFAPNVSKKSYRYVKPGHPDAPTLEMFYTPQPDGVRTQIGRPGHYTYEPLPAERVTADLKRLEEHYVEGWNLYQDLVANGWCMEQARFALSTGLVTRLYLTTSYRNWFNWLIQRNDSHTQGETQVIGAQVEEIIRQCCPLTYELWTDHGRRMI